MVAYVDDLRERGLLFPPRITPPLGSTTKMWWSHADAAAYRTWIEAAGLEITTEESCPRATGATPCSGRNAPPTDAAAWAQTLALPDRNTEADDRLATSPRLQFG